MNQPDFWRDQNRARSVSQQAEALRTEIAEWSQLRQAVEEALELSRSSVVATDQALAAELQAETKTLTTRFEKLEFLVLFSGPYDSLDAVVTIHAGTGGVEAQDWAAMLLRMYLRYSERKKWVATVIDETRGQEAGIKSVVIEISGRYAYGWLQAEAGVHRLVRISPFDAEKMRHTSFALVEVVPELTDVADSELKESDLKIETMRASGHGGQGVNTTDSAVRITHLPTGIVVKCQNERSQVQNRQTALKILSSKLAERMRRVQRHELDTIRGDVLAAEWGNQIRSYVLQPYRLVKDHRTKYETPDTDAVLEGSLDQFAESYLRYHNQSTTAKISQDKE